MHSGPCGITKDPDTDSSLGSVAALSNYFAWSNRRYYLFFKILLSFPPQTRQYYSCQAKTKAHNISKFNFLPLHGMSEKQLASWAWGRRLAPEESSQQMTQLQLPPERQLVETANRVARGGRILPSNLHYASLTTLLQNTKSKEDACISQAFYSRQVGINYTKPSFTSNSFCQLGSRYW